MDSLLKQTRIKSAEFTNSIHPPMSIIKDEKASHCGRIHERELNLRVFRPIVGELPVIDSYRLSRCVLRLGEFYFSISVPKVCHIKRDPWAAFGGDEKSCAAMSAAGKAVGEKHAAVRKGCVRDNYRLMRFEKALTGKKLF